MKKKYLIIIVLGLLIGGFGTWIYYNTIKYPIKLNKESLSKHFEKFSRGTLNDKKKIDYVSHTKLGKTDKATACFLESDKPVIAILEKGYGDKYRIQYASSGGEPAHRRTVKTNSGYYMIVCGNNKGKSYASIKIEETSEGKSYTFNLPTNQDGYMFTKELDSTWKEEMYIDIHYYDADGKEQQLIRE